MKGKNFIAKAYPEKSWSISRVKTLKNCLRQYYYTYYGSHRGWEMEVSEERKLAWRLKKLTNIWIYFGDIIHEGIKNIIKFQSENPDKEVDVDRFKNFIKLKLNILVKQSSKKDRDIEWDTYPKGNMLQEYYYDGKINKDDIEEVKERIEQCTENFFESKTFFDVCKGNFKNILEIDEGSFNHIFIHTVKVFSIIDMLYIDKDNNYIIVDWKTGKYDEENKYQILVYAIYVMEKYNIPLDHIKGRIEYLYLGENYEYIFTKEDIEDIKKRIKLELNVIDALLDDKNLNKPKSKETFLMCEEDYKCSICKYKRLCKKGGC